MTVREQGWQQPAHVASFAPVRQRLTLLFTDLTGSTVLARMLEPEHLSEVMEAIRGIWHRVVESHDGRIVRSQGDGALVLFGFPESREDDGKRAAQAALEIHAAVAQLRFPALPCGTPAFAMHSGIHAGTVLLSPGDIERGRFDLTGDVINTAAHLARLAQAGQAMASLEALGPHAYMFDLGNVSEGLPGLPAAGIRVLLGATGLRRRFDATARRGLTPLVGRDSFVARISAFLAADPGTAQERCLLIVGDAGIGKTRLLEETVAGHVPPDVLVLRGGCELDLGAEVLQPFAEMLRCYLGISRKMRAAEMSDELRERIGRLAQELPEAVDGLLQLVSYEGEPPATRKNTSGGIVEDLLAFLNAIAARRPTLLLLDDWQWADDASLQLLSALLARPDGPRLVLAMRPSEGVSLQMPGALLLNLTPLAEADTRQAVRKWLPYADPFVCAQIHQYSGGIPLFVEELCHSASVGELARAIEGKGATRNWIASLAVTRLGRLPTDLARIVRAAAVIGNEAPLWLIAVIVGRAPAQDVLAALARADFLYPADAAASVRFKHGITRDAIYESIGLRERTSLHEQVLSALLQGRGGEAGEEDVEALAHHSRGAGRWEQASACAERAGDKALAALALDRARVEYERAMEALDRVADRTPDQILRWCLLSNKHGMTCVFDPLPLGGDPASFEKAVRLAQSLGDSNASARARYWCGYVCYSLGRFRESRAHIKQALALAHECGDKRLAVQVEATLGQVLAGMGDYEQAIGLIDVAVDAKRQRSRPRGGLAMGSAYALACKGGMLADRGDFADAHGCFEEALALLGGSTHPIGNSVRNWIAVAHNWQGQWDQAAQVAAQSLRIAENTRALLLLAAARGSLGYAQWSGEGSSTGLEQLNEAMRWMEERRSRFYTSIYHGWLLVAEVAEGRRDEVRAHAVKVFQRARQGERLGLAVVCRGLAWVAADQGDGAGAQRWLLRADLAAARRQSAREQALNAWARAQVGERLGSRDASRRWLDAAATQFEALGMRWHAGLVTGQLDGRAPPRIVLT